MFGRGARNPRCIGQADEGTSARIRKLDGSLISLEEKGPPPALPRLRDRHPLPEGEGRYLMCSWCQPSPEGRGWPGAGAFTSRSGPGEGLLGRGSNTRVKQSSNAPFCS
jgi:hypothetical protein